MKFFKTIAATACALAVAGAAQAATYTDSSANYPDGWNSGSNGGDGFGAWSITSTSGSDGWAGFGIWDPSANEFQGSWAGKTAAFGMIGKGEGFSVLASRPFRAALAAGDSFALDMAVNWDSNLEGSQKGFALTAGGEDVVVVNHGAYPGHIYINGDDSSEELNASGTYPISWKFTAKDDTTLTISANSRTNDATLYEADLTVSTSAIDGFRLQSIGQYNENEDRRQSYYDNFALEIAGELPELTTLTFSAAEWAVTSPSQTLNYTLTRSSAAGELDVTVSSSDESFVPGTAVSFADGETEVSFTLNATLTGQGNYAKLTAAATGCDPATFEVKGPNYHVNNGSDSPVSFLAGETADIWINWNGGSRDDSKLTLTADPEGVIEVPTDWSLPEEGDVYVQASVTALASGDADLILAYDGIEMARCKFSVLPFGFELSGPTTAKTGTSAVYTLSGTFATGSDEADISVTTGDATVDPTFIEEVVNGQTYDLTVTFGETAGTVTLSVTNSNHYVASLDIAVSEPVDPSDFDSYVAYDDASLYEGIFDFEALGAGQEGFQPWSVFKDSAQHGDAIVTTADGGFPAILTDGKAFAIYANGNDPDYAIYRPFVNDLQPGQKASIEFVVAENPGSALYVQFARVWEGTPYSRFEFWANGSGYGVNVDGAEGTALGWAVKPRRVVASIQLAADGSEYTIDLAGYDEGAEFVSDIYQHVVKADIGSWGEGIQGIAIGGYNLATDCIFNKLAIEQVEEPVVTRTISISGTWNPDAAGDYEFSVVPSAGGEAIGTVALSVSPADGLVSLSADSVELTGDDPATFTVTLSELPAEETTFTITATPADETVSAATYDITPVEAFCYLNSENWEHTTDDTEIWISLSSSPSRYGTYTITSSDEAVLTVPEASASITVDAENTEAWFNVLIAGAGQASIVATLSEEVSCDFGFTVNEGSGPADPFFTGKTTGFVSANGTLMPSFGVTERGLVFPAADLDGATLTAVDALGEDGAESWTSLKQGVDYVVEGDDLIVLFGNSAE